jgi:hypothetical protein
MILVVIAVPRLHLISGYFTDSDGGAESAPSFLINRSLPPRFGDALGLLPCLAGHVSHRQADAKDTGKPVYNV